MRTTRPSRTQLGIWPTPLQTLVRRLLDQVRQLSKADPDKAIARLRVRAHSDSRNAMAGRAEARCGVLLDPVFAGSAWHAFFAQWAGPARGAGAGSRPTDELRADRGGCPDPPHCLSHRHWRIRS